MQSACSSGYNTMLPTNESPCGFASMDVEQPAPQLQMVTNGMAGMQMGGSVSMISSTSNTSQLHRFGSASPLKRHNVSVDSPRAQLEQKQRRRFLEQKQIFGSGDSDAGPSTAQQQLPQYGSQRVNLWMQDHHGGLQFPLDLKQFPAQASSTVSGLSAVSALSGMSNMTRFTTLSVDTRCSLQTNYEDVYGSYVYQQYPSPLLNGENMDPQFAGPSLMDLLQMVMTRNQVPEYRMRALKDLYDRVKSGMDVYEMNTETRLHITWVVTCLPSDLAPYLNRSQFLYVMERCLGVLHELIVGVHPAECHQLAYQIRIRRMALDLIKFLNECFNLELSNFGEAIVILSTLLEIKQLCSYFSKLTAQTIHITTLMQISNKSTKKSKLLNCMRFMLYVKNIREQFIRQCNGIVWIIQQLEKDAAEKNLLVAMSIVNLLTKSQPGIIQQIINLQGIQVIANLLTHGSPALLGEVGKFLQNMGESIRDIYFEEPQIKEAVAKSVQTFGSSDLGLVGYLSGFLCNFTTRPLPAQLVSKNKGISIITHLLTILWYHELPATGVSLQAREKLNDCIDNLFFILCNLTSDRCDKPLDWSSTQQLSQHSNVMLFLLDVLQGDNIDQYVHRVVLLLNRLFLNTPHLLNNLHNIFGANNLNYVPAAIKIYHRCIEQLSSEKVNPEKLVSQQSSKFTLLNRVLELLHFLCYNPALKAGIIANVKTKQCYSPLELLFNQCTQWGLEDTTIRTLDLIDSLTLDILSSDRKEVAQIWSEFDILVQKSGLMQRFGHSKTVVNRIYEISAKVTKIVSAICEKQNMEYMRKY